MPWLKLNKGERRKIGVFISSLFLAGTLWFFYALSNRYTYPLKFSIQWIELPKSQKFNALQADTLEATVAGSGWQMLFRKLQTGQTDQLKISLKELNHQSFIALKPQFTSLNAQLTNGQKIIGIKPDTLFFNRSDLLNKRVPVKLNYQLNFQALYGLSQTIKIKPDSVSLTGTAEDLAKINGIETVLLKKTGLNSSLNQIVAIKNPSYKIQVYPQQVSVSIPISSLTEKVLNLPVKVINNTKQLKIKLIPARVKITISTALSNYTKINPDDFEAYVDFNQWTSKKIDELPIKLSKKPGFIRVLKIEPQTLDFIIYP